MRLSGKQILIAIILIQLIILPILLIAAKNQQETRSQAAQEQTQTQIQEEILPASGMADAEQVLEESKTTRFEQETSAPTQTAATKRAKGVSQNPKIKKEVYAFIWYPYVDSDGDNGGAYLQYPYMTTLAYAGLSLGKDGNINKNDTSYKVWKSQRFKKIMTDAKTSGVKIHPRIATFDSDRVNYLLATKQRRDKAIANIISEIKNAPVAVDGVNIDFEPVPTQSRDEFTDFIKNLRSEMDKVNPDLEIVIDTFASTAQSEGGFNLKALSPYVDGFFIMSFSFVQKGSAKKAGSFNPYSAYVKVADEYLKKVSADKIIMGYPFYTNRWSTKDNSPRAAKKDNGGGGLILYKDAHAEASTYGKEYLDSQKSAWYSYYECKDKPGWRQVYFDDERSLTDKFKLINNKNLRGIGFWTFNHDQSLDTWNAIYNSFADKASIGAPALKQGAKAQSYKPNSNCKPPNATKTPTKSPTASPTKKPKPSPTGGTQTPTPTQISTNSEVALDVKLRGIGSDGNPTPVNQNFEFRLDIFAPDAVKVGTFTQELTFDQTSGTFKGNVGIGLPKNGFYNIYISSPAYLAARADQQLSINSLNQLPPIFLSPGDVNQDSTRDLLDWNIINACANYPVTRNQKTCPNDSPYMTYSDLDNDGLVNSDDLTLWIQEFLGK